MMSRFVFVCWVLFGIETFRATHRSIYDVVLRSRQPVEPLASLPTGSLGLAARERRAPISRSWSREKVSGRRSRVTTKHGRASTQWSTRCARASRSPSSRWRSPRSSSSMGITDAVAAEDYGLESSFELAEWIFDDVREDAPGTCSVCPAGDRGCVSRTLDLYVSRALRVARARSLVSIAPLAMLLASTQALSASGLSTRPSSR